MSIMNISTNGASARTASQDGYQAGVASSEAMAKRDGDYIQAYKNSIFSVGSEFGIEPALIAAIISRESRGGTAISQTNGWGDRGNAWGLMQVDKNWHNPVGGWNSREHIHQATDILVKMINSNDNPFARSRPEHRLKAGIAGYNMGFRNMSPRFDNIDDHTTGGDYSNDVVARAQYFKRNGY